MPILKIHKNALYVNNELVKFQFEIDTVLVLDSQVIVLIKTPYDIATIKNKKLIALWLNPELK